MKHKIFITIVKVIWARESARARDIKMYSTHTHTHTHTHVAIHVSKWVWMCVADVCWCEWVGGGECVCVHVCVRVCVCVCERVGGVYVKDLHTHMHTCTHTHVTSWKFFVSDLTWKPPSKTFCTARVKALPVRSELPEKERERERERECVCLSVCVCLWVSVCGCVCVYEIVLHPIVKALPRSQANCLYILFIYYYDYDQI